MNGMQWFNNLLFPAQCRFVDLIEGGAHQVFAAAAAMRMDKKLSGDDITKIGDCLQDAARIQLSPFSVRKMRAQVRRLVHS